MAAGKENNENNLRNLGTFAFQYQNKGDNAEHEGVPCVDGEWARNGAQILNLTWCSAATKKEEVLFQPVGKCSAQPPIYVCGVGRKPDRLRIVLGRLDGTLWLLDTRDGIKCSFEIIGNGKKKTQRRCPG